MARSKSSFEATAEEWRLQDGASHAYSSRVSRSFNFAASQSRCSLNSFACSIRAVRLGTRQVKFRGNRLGVASRLKLFMSTAQMYHDPVISQHRKTVPLQCHILKAQSFCEPCSWQAEPPRLGLTPVNRQGMALGEKSAPCVPMRVTWGRYRRGSAPMSMCSCTLTSTTCVYGSLKYGHG